MRSRSSRKKWIIIIIELCKHNLQVLQILLELPRRNDLVKYYIIRKTIIQQKEHKLPLLIKLCDFTEIT